MSDKIYLGNRVSELDMAEQPAPISRVIITVDSEHYYTAGNDSGRVYEVNCPWGSQAMAESILAKLSGVQYKPYNAQDAILDPAAEIGDAVTVAGLYSVIASMSAEFDSLCAADISAPESDEIDDEYPYEASGMRVIERKLAYTRSLITKTATVIKLQVEDLEKGLGQTLRIAADGVTITNAQGSKLTINGGQIDATKINVADLQLTGAITWADLNSSVQTTINTISTDASTAKNNANTALSAFEQITLTSGGRTYIDGSMIYSRSIYSNALHLAGMLTIYASENSYDVGGYVGYQPSTSGYGGGMSMVGGSSEVAVSSGGAALRYYSGSTLANQVSVVNGSVGIRAANIDYAFDSASFYNVAKCTLGTASNVWGQIYSTNSAISTSDRNAKWDINYDIDAKYDRFWSLLRPCTGKYIDGTSGRDHLFLISQDVEDAMTEAGLSSLEFAGFIKSPNEEGDGYIYALRYEEFIPLAIREIQMLQKKVAALEARVAV